MTKLILYYYLQDPSNLSYYINYNNKSETNPNKSLNNIFTYTLYDNNFKEVGLLKMNTTSTTQNNLGYYNYEFTIYINNSNDVIVSSYAFNSQTGTEFLTPGHPINMSINYCSGDIYKCNGTVTLLPFDNEPKSRMLLIDLC